MFPDGIRANVTSWHYQTRRHWRRASQSIHRRGRVCPEKNFVFLHVPKAGGTSIRHFFRKVFLEDSIYPEHRLSNFPLWGDVKSEKYKAYLGHLGWSFAQSANAETAMLLRDPIERLLSLYTYTCKRSYRQPLIGGLPNNMSLIQFLKSDNVGVRQNLDNAQTWQLYHCYHWEQREKLAGESAQSVFRAASKNLKKISWLGVSEDLSSFCARLSLSKIKIIKKNPRKNISTSRTYYSELSDTEKKAILNCVEMDMALYEKAKTLLIDNAS